MSNPVDAEAAAGQFSRVRVLLRGAVQGLGIRPALYRLASGRGLAGWVRNSVVGVELELEGPGAILRQLLEELRDNGAGLDADYRVEASWGEARGYREFAIIDSDGGGAPATAVLPDLACCADCLQELFDPGNRRFRYPFINCTRCGPRYSIIDRLPYDRQHTSMRDFDLCAACRKEYGDPGDRRFHAQPNACADCGPQLAFRDSAGREQAQGENALGQAVAAIRRGQIIAVKGLGGFQLMVDACDAEAVARLRDVKQRWEKPFALMCPDPAHLARLCDPDQTEWALLHSAAAPIVLVRKSRGRGEHDFLVGECVAPGYPDIGVMLPCTPLHHLLLRDLGGTVVATSGNRAGEVICSDEAEALLSLDGLADGFLVHDRPILRAVDDSIVRVVAGRSQVLRSARGYAPLVLELSPPSGCNVAVGGHQKTAVALAMESGLVLGPHIGDLDTPGARAAHRATLASLQRLYGVEPAGLGCDLHPDYASTTWAMAAGMPVHGVQHHYAHALACMADNHLGEDVLAVVWDGSGYGLDGTIWGGEFLCVGRDGFSRAAHWRPFALPGAEKAVREPRRVAFSLLYSLHGDRAAAMDHLPPVGDLAPAQRRGLVAMLAAGVNVPLTTSVGRLFDAVAALLDICQQVRSEGHAACLLEALACRGDTSEAYPVVVNRELEAPQLDWEPLLLALLADWKAGVPVEICAARFHHALVEGLVAVAELVGRELVVLSGGCFQNRYLAERAVARLRAEGFRPYWHHRVPPNDGGLAVGQLVAAGRAGVCV